MDSSVFSLCLTCDCILLHWPVNLIFRPDLWWSMNQQGFIEVKGSGSVFSEDGTRLSVEVCSGRMHGRTYKLQYEKLQLNIRKNIFQHGGSQTPEQAPKLVWNISLGRFLTEQSPDQPIINRHPFCWNVELSDFQRTLPIWVVPS